MLFKLKTNLAIGKISDFSEIFIEICNKTIRLFDFILLKAT